MSCRAETGSSKDDVCERLRHLVTNRVDDLCADIRQTGRQRRPPRGLFGHEPDDRNTPLAIEADQMTDRWRRQLEVDGPGGLDRERLVIGDAGPRHGLTIRP